MRGASLYPGEGLSLGSRCPLLVRVGYVFPWCLSETGWLLSASLSRQVASFSSSDKLLKVFLSAPIGGSGLAASVNQPETHEAQRKPTEWSPGCCSRPDVRTGCLLLATSRPRHVCPTDNVRVLAARTQQDAHREARLLHLPPEPDVPSPPSILQKPQDFH